MGTRQGLPIVHVLLSVVWTTNAKVVGCLYLLASMAFGTSGLLLSWVLRGEIGGLGEQLLFGDHQLYNVLITSTRDHAQRGTYGGYALHHL